MPPTDSPSSLAAKAKWPLFLIANLAVLLVVGVSTVRESYRGWTVDHEISALESKAQALEGRKMELGQLAARMQEPSYVERQARSKLGLQKPGEKVVVSGQLGLAPGGSVVEAAAMKAMQEKEGVGKKSKK